MPLYRLATPGLAYETLYIHRLLQEQVAAQAAATAIARQNATGTLAATAAAMVESFFEYISHTFTPAPSDADDAQFEERFKYFICTSPFLNKNATLHAVRDHRLHSDVPVSSEISAVNTPARLGLTVGTGSLALVLVRMVIARVNVKGWSWLQPVLHRILNGVFALVSSAWLYRIVQKRRSQMLYNQALQALQHLVHQCQNLDVKVNRAITAIHDLETSSRTQRLTTNMTPVSRLELASRMRHLNLIRTQLAASLFKSGALFQQSTEALQSHIDHKRLSALLDMYNITPSSRPTSPEEQGNERRTSSHLSLGPTSLEQHPSNPNQHHSTNDRMTHHALSSSATEEYTTASPISDTQPPNATLYPPSNSHPVPSRPNLNRRSRTLSTPGLGKINRTFSMNGTIHGVHPITVNAGSLDQRPPSRRSKPARRHTSWSASEGEESDSGSTAMMTSPRSSIYTNHTGNNNSSGHPSSTTASFVAEMAMLKSIQKDFQRMHGNRREFFCELLSIRKKSQRGHTGAKALKDYD
ncbi:hypothetical protein BGZ94_003687, partial [Podila epigama]